MLTTRPGSSRGSIEGVGSHWPFLLAGAGLLAAYALSGEFEWLFGLPVLWLVWRVESLARRLRGVERALELRDAVAATGPARADDLEFDTEEILGDALPVPTPSAAEAAAAARAAAWQAAAMDGDAAAGQAEPRRRATRSSTLRRVVRGFFTDGNLLARIGILILFFGVAFLLKYAADNAYLPIGLRLAGAVAGGLFLLVLGWRLRQRRRVYALLLQGAGIGVMYLSLFAAARLYELIPLGGAFALMLAVVVLSAVLAVLQNARHLAAFAAAGGFLAPILTAGEQGDPVLLFGYYACLNLGIFAIAWFRAWRELNLLGFAFTFVIGGAWGYFSYADEHFRTTLGFLVLFMVLFTAVAVLFAHRAPLRLRGYVDGTLVFGVPLLGFGLLGGMLREQPLQLALAAVIASACYLTLARALWRRRIEGMRLLTEALLAVGVVFASLAIPLGLDSQWTAGLWAAEGAGLVWIGLAQQRRLARWFGLLLQFGAALALAWERDWLAAARPILNPHYIGALIIALAGLISAWLAWRQREHLLPAERRLSSAVLIWALVWWFGAGWMEALRSGGAIVTVNAHVLIFNGVSLIALLGLRRRLDWQPLDRLLSLFPAVLWAHLLVLMSEQAPALVGRGSGLWPLALALSGGLLWYSRGLWPDATRRRVHESMLWFGVVFIGHEAYRHLQALSALGEGWAWAAMTPAALLAVWVLPAASTRLPWPVAENPHWYRGRALEPLVIALLVWNLAVAFIPANPAPLAYLPVLNPVELAGLAVVLVVLRLELSAEGSPLKDLPPGALAAGSAFVWLTTVVARAVHYRTGISYDPSSLLQSNSFQTSISVVWTVLAMLVTLVASRRGRRPLWFLGAGLLLVVVIKLFLVDLGGTGTVERIVSFMVVGILMLSMGYFSPLPPRRDDGP